MKHEYLKRASIWDVIYSINMGIACWIAYAIMTWILISPTSRDDDLLGGMWAAVAAAFVFRDTRADSLSAGLARLIATCVSFALCLLYLAFAPPSAVGISILVTVGTLVMIVSNRREDIVTAAVTTIVIMVVAIISPAHAWRQPLLRLLDTVIGIGVGISFKWAASKIFAGLRCEAVKTDARER